MGTVILSFINIRLVLWGTDEDVCPKCHRHPRSSPKSAVAHAKPQGYQRSEKKLLGNVTFRPFQTYDLLQSAELALLLGAEVCARWESGICGHLGLRSNSQDPPRKAKFY